MLKRITTVLKWVEIVQTQETTKHIYSHDNTWFISAKQIWKHYLGWVSEKPVRRRSSIIASIKRYFDLIALEEKEES